MITQAPVPTGVENSRCTVIFVTESYVRRVTSADRTDWCFREFEAGSKKAGRVLAVLMEERMRTFISVLLGGMEFVDMIDDYNDLIFDVKCDELRDKILKCSAVPTTSSTYGALSASSGSSASVGCTIV